MASRWTCIAHPASHGSFSQKGLDHLAVIAPKMQPRNRYACPKCIAFDFPGWVRPTEAARQAAQQGV